MRADASGGKTAKSQPTLVDENSLLNARSPSYKTKTKNMKKKERIELR